MTIDPLEEVFRDLPAMLTVDHVSTLTHLTPRTIRSKLASKEIPGGTRISVNRWLVPASCVRNWLETRETPDSTTP